MFSLKSLEASISQPIELFAESFVEGVERVKNRASRVLYHQSIEVPLFETAARRLSSLVLNRCVHLRDCRGEENGNVDAEQPRASTFVASLQS